MEVEKYHPELGGRATRLRAHREGHMGLLSRHPSSARKKWFAASPGNAQSRACRQCQISLQDLPTMSPFVIYTSQNGGSSRACAPRQSPLTQRPSRGSLTAILVTHGSTPPEDAGQSVPVPAPAAPGPRAGTCPCVRHKAAFALTSS